MIGADRDPTQTEHFHNRSGSYARIDWGRISTPIHRIGHPTHEHPDMSTKISPLAGKPAPPERLVNVSKLVAAYYDQWPDPSVPAQRVALRSGLIAVAMRPAT